MACGTGGETPNGSSERVPRVGATAKKRKTPCDTVPSVYGAGVRAVHETDRNTPSHTWTCSHADAVTYAATVRQWGGSWHAVEGGSWHTRICSRRPRRDLLGRLLAGRGPVRGPSGGLLGEVLEAEGCPDGVCDGLGARLVGAALDERVDGGGAPAKGVNRAG